MNKEKKRTSTYRGAFWKPFYGVQMEELCKKLHTVVFVSDVGHPCQRGDVCEVAPILQSHNALQIFKFGAEKGGWAPLKSASRAQACMSWDRETVFPKPKNPRQRSLEVWMYGMKELQKHQVKGTKFA